MKYIYINNFEEAKAAFYKEMEPVEPVRVPFTNYYMAIWMEECERMKLGRTDRIPSVAILSQNVTEVLWADGPRKCRKHTGPMEYRPSDEWINKYVRVKEADGSFVSPLEIW